MNKNNNTELVVHMIQQESSSFINEITFNGDVLASFNEESQKIDISVIIPYVGRDFTMIIYKEESDGQLVIADTKHCLLRDIALDKETNLNKMVFDVLD